MGANQFIINILWLATLSNAIHDAVGSDLYVNPKDEVEFVNPYESSASATNDMGAPVEERIPSELLVTTTENMPFSGTIRENGTIVGAGYAFYIFDLIRSHLNFTYKIVPSQEAVIGDEKRGVIAKLIRQEVDMVVSFLPILPEFQNLISYSTALDEIQYTILAKRPGESATGSGLLAPFDTTVWILINVSVLAVGPIMYLLILVRLLICKNGETRQYTLSNCMWFVYGALLKQGSTMSPVTDSARLLFATWWIFITILTSFYTANLTAFLTLSQFTLPINTVQDLANKNQKWIARSDSMIERIVKQQNNDELKLLRDSLDRGYGEFLPIIGVDNQQVLQLVRQNKMYLRERPLVTQLLFEDYLNKTRAGIAEADRCTFVITHHNILTKRRGFAYRINNTFGRILDSKLLSLVESGIIRHKTSEHLPGTEICPLNLGSKERQLRNTDLTMTYKGIGIGFTIALIAFVGEVIYRRWIKPGGEGEGEGEGEGYNQQHVPVYRTEGAERSPPPLYQNINIQEHTKRHYINGRDYYVVTERDGEKRLVPVRTPSAFLYQYPA